jgi:predicted NBD/HSP70 family sugar kinase
MSIVATAKRQVRSGPGDVFQLIRLDEANTRKDLQLITGLSRMTVAQRVDSLLAAGLIREAGEGDATGGRRPSRLEFDVDRSMIAVASVDTTHSSTALTNLDGTIHTAEVVETAISDGPEAVLNELAASFQRLLEQAGRPLADLAGIGIAVPGPVDPHNGRPSQPPIMPGWDAYPVIEHLQKVLPVPVFVENDADAMAYGEQSAVYPDCSSLCLVKVSTGIGTGVVINGTVYHGVDGGAGDIGHIRLAGETALCQCGSRGCLAAVASGRAVAEALTARGVTAQSGRDISRLVAEGSVDTLSLIHEAGLRIGEVMATVISVVNPGVLVISGDLASSALIGGIRETLYPRSLARATRNLEIRLSALGEDAGLIGMARLVVNHLYSADQVNSRLLA